MRVYVRTNIDTLIYVFIAIRLLIDLGLVVVMSVQHDSWIGGGAMWIICWVFYLLLFFGTRTETFHGRYGSKVYRWREPEGWWFVFGFIVLFHLAVTIVISYLVIDWSELF